MELRSEWVNLLRCYIILCPKRGHHVGSDADLISWACGLYKHRLGLRQGHHMGNVHNPALSLHLRFFLWAVCFPTCCSECLIILSSLRWTEQCQTGEVVGQGEMDRWMDGWMDGVDWHSVGHWQCNRRKKTEQGDQRLALCWPMCVVAIVTDAFLQIYMIVVVQ